MFGVVSCAETGDLIGGTCTISISGVRLSGLVFWGMLIAIHSAVACIYVIRILHMF